MTKAEVIAKWKKRAEYCGQMADDYTLFMKNEGNIDTSKAMSIEESYYWFWLGKWGELKNLLEELEAAAD